MTTPRDINDVSSVPNPTTRLERTPPRAVPAAETGIHDSGNPNRRRALYWSPPRALPTRSPPASALGVVSIGPTAMRVTRPLTGNAKNVGIQLRNHHRCVYALIEVIMYTVYYDSDQINVRQFDSQTP